MTTYSKETALYNTGAIGDDITEAGTKATNYLSADSSGIMVYDGSNGQQTPSNPSSTTNNVFIDSNSLDIRKGTDVLATFGSDKIVVGRTATGVVRTEISNKDFQIIEVQPGREDVPIMQSGYDSILNYLRYSIGVRGQYYDAEDYSSSETYEVGDICKIGNGRCFICKTEISTPEAFTQSHWQDAVGPRSVVLGDLCISGGGYSIAAGYRTIALGNSTMAIGKFNNIDVDNTYIFIIGNGTSETARSNALTVDWNGNLVASGNIKDGSNNILANKANGAIRSGGSSATNVSANSYTDIPITFSSAMPNIPVVTVSLVSSSTAGAIGNLSVAVKDGSVSTTGFTARVFNAGSTARTPAISYIAFSAP